MDHTANPEPNTGKGLTLAKFHWDGINLRQVRPTLRAWESHASPEAHGFCGREINAQTTDSVRKKGGGKWMLGRQPKAFLKAIMENVISFLVRKPF